MRASDTDRDQVTQLLQAAYAEGRISYAEHDERTAAALRAKTFDELEDLTADLVPVAPAVPSTVDTVRGQRRVRPPHRHVEREQAGRAVAGPPAHARERVRRFGAARPHRGDVRGPSRRDQLLGLRRRRQDPGPARHQRARWRPAPSSATPR